MVMMILVLVRAGRRGRGRRSVCVCCVVDVGRQAGDGHGGGGVGGVLVRGGGDEGSVRVDVSVCRMCMYGVVMGRSTVAGKVMMLLLLLLLMMVVVMMRGKSGHARVGGRRRGSAGRRGGCDHLLHVGVRLDVLRAGSHLRFGAPLVGGWGGGEQDHRMGRKMLLLLWIGRGGDELGGGSDLSRHHLLLL